MKMNRKKKIIRGLGGLALVLLICTMEIKLVWAAVLTPSSTGNQGGALVKSYPVYMEVYRNTVGTSNVSHTFQIDLTGVDRIVVSRVFSHSKCGNCNGSAGYTGASMLVAGKAGYAPAYGPSMEVSGLEAYGLGITDVTISASASINNLCASCGGSSNEYSAITNITTYSYPPSITKQPAACSVGTDETASFQVEGTKIAGYTWQKKEADTYVNLTDTTLENGMTFSGTATGCLTVSGVRYMANESSYRCVLLGEDGKELISQEAVMTVVDKTIPQVIVKQSPQGFTNQDVKIELLAEDRDTGMAEAAYSWDGGQTYGSTAIQSVSENKSIQIAIRDKAGNTYSETVMIRQIDKIPPVISLSMNSIEETTAPVSIAILAEDKESGLHDIPYYYHGGWNTNATAVVTKNGSYEILVRDKAGNTASAVCLVENIQQVNPPGGKGTADGKQETGGGDTGTGSTSTDTAENVQENEKEIQAVLPAVVPVSLPETVKKQNRRKNNTNAEENAGKKEEQKIELDKKEEQKAVEEIEIETVENQTIEEQAEIQTEKREEKSRLPVIAGLLAGGMLLLLFLFVLFFGVLIEQPEQKNRIVALSFVYPWKRRWNTGLGNLLHKHGSLKLRFGILFITLFEGWEIAIHTKEQTGECDIETISQHLLVSKNRIRRH